MADAPTSQPAAAYVPLAAQEAATACYIAYY